MALMASSAKDESARNQAQSDGLTKSYGVEVKVSPMRGQPPWSFRHQSSLGSLPAGPRKRLPQSKTHS